MNRFEYRSESCGDRPDGPLDDYTSELKERKEEKKRHSFRETDCRGERYREARAARRGRNDSLEEGDQNSESAPTQLVRNLFAWKPSSTR